MFDYETLRLMWWLLLGVFLAGFAVTDGYDLGVGAILRLIARDDVERRMASRRSSRIWAPGVFIRGGGGVPPRGRCCMPPRFPVLFRAAVVLLALILPGRLRFPHKLTSLHGRHLALALTIAGVVPSSFRRGVRHLFLGVPFHFTDSFALRVQRHFLALFLLRLAVLRGQPVDAVGTRDVRCMTIRSLARVPAHRALAAIVALVASWGASVADFAALHVLASVVDGNDRRTRF